MARIKEWMDKSEMGNAASLTARGWVATGGGTTVAATPFHDGLGNGGSYSIALVSSSGTLSWLTPVKASPIPTFYLRFHGNIDVGFASTLVYWNGPTIAQGRLAVDSSGHLQIYSGAGTLLATSTNVIAAGTWYLIEVGITIGNAGSYEVRVNRTSVGWIPPAVGDTQPGSDTTVQSLQFLRENATGGGTNYFDDIAVDDAGFLGEGLITACAPTGAGTTTQLTPSSGANWQCVDEIPPSDADYNKATAANQKDTYALADLPATAASIKCVMPVARVIRAAGEAIGTAYLVMRSGGTDYEGAGHNLDASYAIIDDLRETDPATGVAWTPSGVNAAEVGVRFDT